MLKLPSKNAPYKERLAAKEAFLSTIDQTALSPGMGEKSFSPWLKASARLPFATLCISPYLVPIAISKLGENNEIKLCSVVNFPLGTNSREVSNYQAETMVKRGVKELDLVMNIAQFKEGARSYVFDSIVGIMNSAKQAVPEGVSVDELVFKVIIETAALDSQQIFDAAELVASTGAHFIKTSTGFSSRGASLEDVTTIKEAAPSMGIKASGGIKTLQQAFDLLDAGATRLGSSRGLELADQFDREFNL